MIEKEKRFPIFYLPMIMLFLAVLPLPYGYYNLLKITVCSTFGYQLFYSYSKTKRITSQDIPLIIAIFIYNPIMPIHLGRPIWTFINLITIAIIIYRLKQLRTKSP